MCWSDAYLIIDLGDQHVDNYKNNVTHISILAPRLRVEPDISISIDNPAPSYNPHFQKPEILP